jgi:tetratricopeptide (TPR) repeat protein
MNLSFLKKFHNFSKNLLKFLTVPIDILKFINNKISKNMGFIMEDEENNSIQDIPVNIQVLKIVENGENIYNEDPLKFNDLLKDIVNKNIYNIRTKKIEIILDELNDYLYSNNKSIKKLNIKLKRAKNENDYSKSLDIIDKILKIQPKDLKILNAHFYLHLIDDMDKYENFEKKNNSLRYVKIRETINKILEIDPEDQEKLVMNYYIDNQLYLTEEDIAQEEEEINKLEKNIKYGEAAALFDEGKTKEGLSLTNQIFLEYEDGYDFWDYNDSAVNKLDNSEGTIEFLKMLVQENPKNTDVQFKLGELYGENGEYETAIKYYDIAIASGDEVFISSGMFEKVKILRELKRFDEALNIVERGIENGGELIDFAQEKCLIYTDMGKYDLAMDLVSEFYDYNFSCLKGYIYLQWKKYKKAEKCFRSANKLVDNFYGELEFYLAVSLKEQKKYGDALKYLKKVPFNEEYTKYYNKAQDLIAEIESMNVSQEELKIYEEEEELKMGEAANLIDKGKYEEGLTLINKIFIEYEDGYVFWDYNDYGLNKLENSEETIEFLKTLVEENPKNYEAQFKLGEFYRENGEYETAIKYYDVGIASDDEIFITVGMFEKTKILRKLKRFDEALDIIERGIENGDELIEFAREKCLIYLDMGKYNLAINIADKFIEYYPDFSFLKGCIYLQWKKYRKAEKCFKHSMELVNNFNGRIDFYLAVSLKEQKKYEDALKYLKKVPFNEVYTKYYDKAQDLIAEIENELMVK